MGSIPPDKLAIGRALLAGGPVTHEALERELERSGKGGGALGKALLQSGFPREEELVALLLGRLRIPRINARNTKIPLETIRLLPHDVARRCRCLPLDRIGGILVVVTPDLGNEEALAEVRRASGSLVTPIQCAPDGFEEIIDDYYRQLTASGLAPAEPAASARPAAAPSGTRNGAVAAVPVGDEREDAFWRRYMSAGPVPAEEALL
ncbi:MAG: hypothetical protein D6731_02830 [Planctomycetota bacterium]|nr:MAG: hypothetical protein D6731_02830 [Planctomycetota bacterium]